MKLVHVLFVCLGNICRSPMAEALARKYGLDVLMPSSAGLTPAPGNHTLTRSVLKEINVDLGDHVPRSFSDVDLSRYDLIVNISGVKLPENLKVPVETWNVEDPFGGPHTDYRRARAEIEMLVMNLILRVRAGKISPLANKRAAGFDSGRGSSRQ